MTRIRQLTGGLLAGVLLALAVSAPAGARLDERIEIPVRDRETEAAATADRPCLYRVRAGDSLWTIAAGHRTDVRTLADKNGLDASDWIREGQLLTLPGGAVGSTTHCVRAGENLAVIADRYRVSVPQLVRENDLADPDLVRTGQELIIPVAADGGPAAPAGFDWMTLLWPADGPLTDGFGMRGDRPHYGIDIAADHGEAIRAAAGGRVTHAGPAGTFGELVILDHGNGLTTYYAHCSKILVRTGDEVAVGAKIACIGDTGRSFGPHLHFETRWDGKPYDPLLYLTQNGGR
jgi:murein DD-endopeptidase MepM/ murein hydrolase activator NlpD